MKDRINFNDRNKKIIIIILIFGICIYLLYFNDRILIQDILQKSLSNNESNITENFNIQKYTDICKNRKTHFYNISPDNVLTTVTSATNNCEGACDADTTCKAFFINDPLPGATNQTPTCKLYKGAILNAQGIDTTIMDISVNCDSNILPPSTVLGGGPTYVGYGFINNNYFKKNKGKFKYIDTGLNSSDQIKTNLQAMRTALNNSQNKTIPDATIPDATSVATRVSIDAYATSLGMDTTNLSWYSVANNFLTDNVSDSTQNTELVKHAKTVAETTSLDNKLKDSDKSGFTNHFFYIILAFIIVFTIILLILYKLNNNAIINDRFMIFYFIVIVCIFTFIHFILNI
jgi:hypothetical protein